MKNNLLVFGNQNFNNSLNEIKEDLNLSLVFYDKNTFSELSIGIIDLLFVDAEVCKNTDILSIINKIKDKPLLLLKGSSDTSVNKLICDDLCILPLSLADISNKVINLITVKKFNQNSSVKINEYIIDKNERKLKKKKFIDHYYRKRNTIN